MTASTNSIDTGRSTPTPADSTSADLRAEGGHDNLSGKFFLVGCERSGSTMLRLMLDRHPELSCMYESDFMVRHFERCRRGPPMVYARLLEDDWHFAHSGLAFPADAASYDEVIDAFFRQRSRATGKRVIGATIHHDFHHLPELCAEGRYVHLVRDGRPVASSMVQMGWAGNLYWAALRWRDTMRRLRALQRRVPPEQWLEVRYEDLLHDPGKWLGDICAFVGVAYSEEMLRYHTDSTYDPPDPANAQRWRGRLVSREIQLAEMAAGDVLDDFGYERLFPAARPGAIERLVLRFDNRITRTRFRCGRYGTYLLVARKLWRLLGVRRAALEQRYQAISEAHIR